MRESGSAAQVTRRPPVPFAAGCLAWLAIVSGVAVTACAGGFSLIFGAVMAPQVADGVAQRERRAALRESRGEAGSLLALLGDSLEVRRVAEGEYPPALDEDPPPDPWGTPIRYTRRERSSAQLRSAGPDRKFGTADDVVRALGRR